MMAVMVVTGGGGRAGRTCGGGGGGVGGEGKDGGNWKGSRGDNLASPFLLPVSHLFQNKQNYKPLNRGPPFSPSFTSVRVLSLQLPISPP